ncbi:hypothetical protein AB0L97_32780 [Nocardia sp. NPDC051911]|uniref:hypothetical protein n=1 Tax=Nocardia sp. NPDC051911 TaxID=3154648 RepID=UPI0034281937
MLSATRAKPGPRPGPRGRCVPAAPSLARIAALRAAGKSYRDIAAAAGVSYNTLHSIVYARCGRGLTAELLTVAQKTEAAILSVPFAAGVS